MLNAKSIFFAYQTPWHDARPSINYAKLTTPATYITLDFLTHKYKLFQLIIKSMINLMVPITVNTKINEKKTAIAATSHHTHRYNI